MSGSLPTESGSEALPASRTSAGPAAPSVGTGGLFVLLALYALSGAAGLVYEVAWGRRLSLVLGATAVSGAVVLAAFLGALGIGARFGGRLADRSRSPLRLYGLLEIGAAAWALLVPFVVPVLEHVYVGAAQGAAPVSRIVLALATALVAVGPAAAMLGATFPTMLRALATGRRSVGGTASLLYGVNTVGAVAGALWAGFSGISTHGVNGTSRLAAFVAAGVGVAALLLSARAGRPIPTADDSATVGTGDAARAPRSALVAALLSGVIALGLEAAGLRILVFFIEGFTVSFAAMLGVFLAGLGVGSLLFGPILARRMRPALAFGVLLVAAGGAVLVLGASIPSFEGVLRGVRDAASQRGDPSEALRRTALSGSMLLFFAPALLLGAAYPVCVRWAGGSDVRGLGARVGRVALWNSVGSVVGPLLVIGVGLLSGAGSSPGGPLLSWTLLGVLALLVGVVSILAQLGLPRRAVPVVGVLVGLGFGFGVPVLVQRATPEALVLASRVVRDARGEVDPRRLVKDVRADETTTATVVEIPSGERILYTDDFAAAATGFNYPYMRMLGHLPALLAKDPRNAMVIAFGTGTTAGSLAATSAFERIELVEASRAVYALAPRFEAVNRSVLEDPRVIRRVDDGRHALLTHAPDLDAITLEPLMPYTPAALPFYTREFYELARDRLREGGVLCQWVPVHAMRPDVYAALLRTFFETFPDGSLWFFEQSTVLVARKGVDAPAPDAVLARATELFKSLYLAGAARPTAVGAGFVATGRRVLEVLDDASKSSEAAMRASPLGPLSRRVVTDDDPFPEAYPAPRAGLATSYEADTLLWLGGVVGPPEEAGRNPLVLPGGDTALRMREELASSLAARAAEARGDFLLATSNDAEGVARANANFEAAASGYEAAIAAFEGGDVAVTLRLARLSRRILSRAARERMADADRAQRAGDASAEKKALEEALSLARRAFEIEPGQPVMTERPQAMALVAEVLARSGRCVEALEELKGPQSNWPRDPSLSDIARWLSARISGRDAAELAGVDRRLVARLAMASPCTGTALGRVGPMLREVEKQLIEGNAIRLRQTVEVLIASRDEWAAEAGDLLARLKAYRDLLAPEVDAERAVLLRFVSPTDERLVTLLGDADPARRAAALRAAAHYGFERAHVLDAVKALNAGAAEPARRVEFAGIAPDDRSPVVRALVVDLLVDPEASVRSMAWRALTREWTDEARTATGYDPEGAEAARAAALPAARAKLLPAVR